MFCKKATRDPMCNCTGEKQAESITPMRSGTRKLIIKNTMLEVLPPSGEDINRGQLAHIHFDWGCKILLLNQVVGID